jgi:hypothetical protein
MQFHTVNKVYEVYIYLYMNIIFIYEVAGPLIRGVNGEWKIVFNTVKTGLV